MVSVDAAKAIISDCDKWDCPRIFECLPVYFKNLFAKAPLRLVVDTVDAALRTSLCPRGSVWLKTLYDRVVCEFSDGSSTKQELVDVCWYAMQKLPTNNNVSSRLDWLECSEVMSIIHSGTSKCKRFGYFGTRS